MFVAFFIRIGFFFVLFRFFPFYWLTTGNMEYLNKMHAAIREDIEVYIYVFLIRFHFIP